MNSYTQLLRNAQIEFRDYAASEKGKSWPADWFVEMQQLLAVAAAEEEDSGAERVMETVGYKISDSGPHDGALSPSFEAASIAAYKKESRSSRPDNSGQRSALTVVSDLKRSAEGAAHTPVRSNMKGWLVGAGIVLLAVSIGLFGRTPAPRECFQTS